MDRVSFGFTKVSKKAALSGPVSGGHDEPREQDNDVVDIHREYIIPMKRTGSDNTASTKRPKTVELDRGSSELERKAVEELIREAQEAGDAVQEEERSVPLLMRNRLDKDDLNDLGEISTANDYDDMPVEHFGKALLRGMGWEKGKGIGRKNKLHLDPIEFIPRSSGRGLGADSLPKDLDDERMSKPRRLKPGETAKREVELPRDADGRVKHTRRVGEALPIKEKKEVGVHSCCRVLAGRHAGLYGRVVSIQVETAHATVRLAISEQDVDVSIHQLQVTSENEYGKVCLRDELRRESTLSYGSDDERIESEHKKKKKKKEHKKKSKKKRHRRESSSSEDTYQPSHSWLAAHLRVRIVSRSFCDGRYYTEKAVIEDVARPGYCAVRTQSGTLLEDVPQSVLETVIPRQEMAMVMIVNGAHRHELGRMMQRDRFKCEAVIQLVNDFSMHMISFDDICEYVGEAHV